MGFVIKTSQHILIKATVKYQWKHTIYISVLTVVYIQRYTGVIVEDDEIFYLPGFPDESTITWWSHICSIDSCSGDDISDNKELEWG